MTQEEPPPDTRGWCETHKKWNRTTKSSAQAEALRMMQEHDMPYCAYRADECGEWHVGRPRLGDDGHAEAFARWIVWQGKEAMGRPLKPAERERVRQFVGVIRRIEAASIQVDRGGADPDVMYDVMYLHSLLGGRPPVELEVWANMQNPDYRTRYRVARLRRAIDSAKRDAGMEPEIDRILPQLSRVDPTSDYERLLQRMYRLFETEEERSYWLEQEPKAIADALDSADT